MVLCGEESLKLRHLRAPVSQVELRIAFFGYVQCVGMCRHCMYFYDCTLSYNGCLF